MRWALERGSEAVRTGLEDNIRIRKERLAASNAELVQVAVNLMTEHGARAATTFEARSIFRIELARRSRLHVKKGLYLLGIERLLLAPSQEAAQPDGSK